MLGSRQEPVRNKILASLQPDDFALLQPWLAAVNLPQHKQLEAPNRPIEHVYFIEHGIASVMIIGGSNLSIEAALIGWEGMTGLSIILDTDRSFTQTSMQSAGEAWRIATNDMRLAMDASATLRRTFLRYAHALVTQMGFTALVNSRCKISERLSRWLLMALDRSDGTTITLTHEYLASMLGVRRAGITNALNTLEKRGILAIRRGAISILDRDALKASANGTYGGPESEYQRTFGAGHEEKGASPQSLAQGLTRH